MGINGGNNSSYALYVNGSVYATGNVYAASDGRLKTNIITIDDALNKVMKLRGVFYERIDNPDTPGHNIGVINREMGVIAQEVLEVIPEVVTYTEDVYGVNYGNITGILIEAIKDLKKELNDLRDELNMLKGIE